MKTNRLSLNIFYLVSVEVRFLKQKIGHTKVICHSGIVIVTITTTSACQNQFALMYTLQLNYKEFNRSFYT